MNNNNCNKISNPKTEVPIGFSLNDKDYISSLLSSLKDMEKNYVIAMTEASNETLYKKFYDIFLEIANLQRDVYEVIFRKGWYSLEQAQNNKISSKVKMLEKDFNDLNI